MIGRATILAGTALWALGIAGAGFPATAQEVVQPLPPAASGTLTAAMRRLSTNPRDLAALLDAGEAATSVGDLEAALGFFGRASAISPNSGRVKLGLATVFARQRRPVEALRLFAEAEQAGIAAISMAADRGLCFDLVGDAKSAQENYRLALARGPDAELTRRLALSQAIAGDKPGFEATLLPLLQKGDLAGFRTRAFGLAVLGDVPGAVKIAEDMMPREMAARMTPYLRYMPRLTQAQQAAAGNLGVFPRGASLAAGDTRVAVVTPSPALPNAQPAITDSPRPARPERNANASVRNAAANPVAASAVRPASPPPPPPPQPPAVAPAPRTGIELEPKPKPLVRDPAGATPPVETTVRPAASSPPVTIVTIPTASKQGAPGGPSELAAVPPSPPPAPPPPAMVVTPAAATPVIVQALPPSTVEDAAPANVADAFAEWALPTSTANRPAEGAVDITAITVRRETAPPKPVVAVPSKPDARPAAPKPKVKTPAELHPARYWVQVATGKSLPALAFDWKRIAKKSDGKLDKIGPFTTRWVEANRLLAGPFASEAAAKDMVKRLKSQGLDAFTYASPAGEEIKPLK